MEEALLMKALCKLHQTRYCWVSVTVNEAKEKKLKDDPEAIFLIRHIHIQTTY